MLKPLNRHLVVEIIDEEKKSSGVLVPDDVKVDYSSHMLVLLKEAHEGSSLSAGCKLVVPTHMIQTLDIFGEKYHVVLENNVIGFFNN